MSNGTQLEKGYPREVSLYLQGCQMFFTNDCHTLSSKNVASLLELDV